MTFRFIEIVRTGLVKRVGPRLRELASATRGSQEAGSRNLHDSMWMRFTKTGSSERRRLWDLT